MFDTWKVHGIDLNKMKRQHQKDLNWVLNEKVKRNNAHLNHNIENIQSSDVVISSMKNTIDAISVNYERLSDQICISIQQYYP